MVNRIKKKGGGGGEDRRARRSNHDFHLALLCFADQLVREKEKKETTEKQIDSTTTNTNKYKIN